jgi:DNA-binding XRE family transcriptional regulator
MRLGRIPLSQGLATLIAINTLGEFPAVNGTIGRIDGIEQSWREAPDRIQSGKFMYGRDQRSVPSGQELREIIGRQVKDARFLRDFTLRQAASRLDISPASLSLMENGKRKISFETLFKMSNIYAVRVDVLLGREAIPGANSRDKKRLAKIADFFSHPLRGSGNSR